MAPVTIEGIPGEGLAVSLLRVSSDPAQRARLHQLLGTFCHQCRNTLNSLKLSLYLAKRSAAPDKLGPWNDLEPRYRDVEQFFERLQLIVRPMPLTTVRLPLALLLEDRGAAWSALLAARERRLDLAPPCESSTVAYDPLRLGDALDSLVAWRAEAGPAGQPARLRWDTVGGQAFLEWSEAAGSGREPPCDGPQSLVLPLLGRVASAHGGSVSVDARDGLRVGLSWPVDASPPKEEPP
jgi:hypothetical protein